jgi:peptide/nickel transport system permease protein
MNAPSLRATLGHLFRRLFRFAAVLLGIALITFSLLDIAPGDPAELVLLARSESPSPQKIEAVRRDLGLDATFFHRFSDWAFSAMKGDLGRSFRTGDAVAREISARLPVTLTLAALTMAFVMVVSTVTGLVSGLMHGGRLDRGIRAWAVLSISMPDFVLGIILIFLFGLKIGLFPVVGLGGLYSYALPVLTLGLSIAAGHGQVLRAGVMEVMNTDYVRFAYSKGLGRWAVIRRHVVKNALLPVVVLWGMSLGHLLGGAVIVENVFSLPGVGTLLVESVLQRDIPLVQGVVLFTATSFVTVNRLVEALMRFFVPSLMFQSGDGR